jgi:hypothetical protein
LLCVYFLSINILTLFVYPDDFFTVTNKHVMRLGSGFSFLTAIALVFGFFVEIYGWELSLLYLSKPTVFLMPPMFIATVLLAFDALLLWNRMDAYPKPYWADFMRNTARLDFVVLLGLVTIFAYSLRHQISTLNEINEISTQLLMFIAGSTTMLMMISNGLFALDILGQEPPTATVSA